MSKGLKAAIIIISVILVLVLLCFAVKRHLDMNIMDRDGMENTRHTYKTTTQYKEKETKL